MNDNTPLKLGLIGCGNFGQFCLDAYSGMKEVEIVAVADIDIDLAKKTAQKYGIQWFPLPSLLIQSPEINLVHIATPPDTHSVFGLQALKYNRHVLCEKPLALSLEDAEDMVNLAKEKKLIIPVDFVLRYVPIVDYVKEIIQSRVLGEPLHAYFENYATDEPLNKNHWFWDEKKSGGIFIEHGVHFFDLYRYWFGETEVTWAYSQNRPNSTQVDRVFCFLRHTSSDVISNHYHGFDQPSHLDRQRHTILFETGDVTIEGWIPIVLTVNGIVDEEKLATLRAICPNTRITKEKEIDPAKHLMKGRGKDITVTKDVRLDYESPLEKMELYAQAVRSLLLDQIKFIRDPKHQRVITEDNGLLALKLAIQATQLSK
ncbi:MAG: Gfo/Idh/MocA family protein [Promethearchaeota archaeon]